MKTTCIWQDKMKFTASFAQHMVPMDAQAPVGSNTAASPKQLLLAGICGCTGMDIVSLLRKYKQEVKSFSIEADAPLTEAYPAVFQYVQLIFKLDGAIDPAKALEAVELSQSKYCGVSAMVSKVVPISYVVEVNGVRVGEGKANFPL